MMKPEFFENAVFTLKTGPVFSVQTTPEKSETQQSAAILNFSLGKLGQGSHVIIVTSLFSKATSFPGSLFSASLGRWKKDPGCGWSCDHPESGWEKNLLDRGGGRVFCVLLWQTLWETNQDHLAVAKNYSFYRGAKSNLPMKDTTRFLPLRGLSFTKKFGSRMEQKLFDG